MPLVVGLLGDQRFFILAVSRAEVKSKAFAKNLKRIIARIENARLSYSSHQIIKLIAVSKYHTSSDIECMYEAGQRAFGENKVQDLKSKTTDLATLPIEWHFIGTLQSNKINTLLSLKPSLVHSVDSLALALALDKKCQTRGMVQDILLQVNASKEDSKHGFALESISDIYAQITHTCANLRLKGIMTIGANVDDKRQIAQCFEQTKKAFDTLQGAEILSMGMSGDFELAIQNGANMVRIGSALFE